MTTKVMRGTITLRDTMTNHDEADPGACACQVKSFWGYQVGGSDVYDEIRGMMPDENVVITAEDEYDPSYNVLRSEIKTGYRFYILEDADPDVTMDQLDATQGMIAMGADEGDMEWAFACYSAATCGVGEWNYGTFGGHTLYEEIMRHDGKYIVLELTVDY